MAAAAEIRVMEKIPRSTLICGKPLGQGGFGNVINGTHNGKDVAVKILHSPVRAESYIEFNFMFQLKHRNLTRMIGLVDLGYTECPQLVFLKANRGNLLQYVQAMEDDVLEPLKMGMLNKFAVDIIHGMEYLHQMHYFHKTLAARNILIHQFGEYLNAQVSDYGISRVIDGQGANYYKTEEGVTLPIRWTPNECIPSGNSTGGFQFASDVWAFGVVLWESWSRGDIPYGAARSNTEVRKLIISGSNPLTFFRPQCPGEVMGVMESIFREKPEERPSFADLGKAFNQMKPKQQRNDKKTPMDEKNDGEGKTGRPHNEKGPRKPKNPQQDGDKAHKHDGGGNQGPKSQNKQQGGQTFPNQRPPNMQNPNQRPPNMQNPNQRPPNMQNPNQRPQNMQNPNQSPQNIQNPFRPPNQSNQNPFRPPNQSNQNPFRPPNQSNQNPGQSGPNPKGKNKRPQVPSDAPPPYSPPVQGQPPSMMGYAGAPPAFAAPPPPPPYTGGGNSEVDMQKRMMELQQKISSLEVKQLEQKLQSLQKEVDGAKFQNKPKNPNQHNPQHKKNPNQNKNPNQPHRPNPNKSQKQHQGGQGNHNAMQGGPANPNIPDLSAAASAIFGMAAGMNMAAAAMSSNSAGKNKK